MKRTFYILSALIFSCIALKAQRPPSISSPDVHPDNTVTFRYYSRSAGQVLVSGEFCLPGKQ